MMEIKRVVLYLFICSLCLLPLAGVHYDRSQETSGSAALTVEEYSIKRDNLYDPGCAHMQKRKKWRISPFAIESLNRKFSSLAYRFVQADSGTFVFYQGDKLLIGGINNIHGVSLDQQGKHFVFFASQFGKRFPENEIVCSDGNIRRCPTKEKFDGWGNLGPAYVKNELVWCEVNYAGDTEHGLNLSHWTGLVRNAKKVFYEFYFEYGAGYMPVRFETAKECWLLQIEDGRVILNGEDLTKKYDYSGMWGYRFLKGKPFFFFREKGTRQIRLSYNGKELVKPWYEFVGDNGGWTVNGNEVMVWFGAVRGDQCYYVEAGVYE